MPHGLIDQVIQYVCSQLCNRWFEPMYQGLADACLCESIHEIHESVWQERTLHLMQTTTWGIYTLRRFPDVPSCVGVLMRHISCLKKANGKCVAFGDQHYPELLRYIKDPPLALNVVGPALTIWPATLAIVGSRNASTFAFSQSTDLAFLLAKAGFLVVSGGAYGCDIACHDGVLSADMVPCPTAVVFASGLGDIGPKRFWRIFDQISASGGSLISERLWSAPARPYDYRARNRIISGLSWATIVMQAGECSGAYMTASTALQQGRDVYVLLHHEDDVRAVGSHQLQRDGALCFEGAHNFLQRFAEVNNEKFKSADQRPHDGFSLSF